MPSATVASIALSAVLFTCLATTYAQAAPTTVFGQGMSSCASWTIDSELGFASWITGFWSALNWNNADNHMVGHSTDGAGIIAVVRRECLDDPSEKLSIATAKAYQKLEDIGR